MIGGGDGVVQSNQFPIDQTPGPFNPSFPPRATELVDVWSETALKCHACDLIFGLGPWAVVVPRGPHALFLVSW